MASLIRLGAVRYLANSLVRTAERGCRHIKTSSRQSSTEGEACRGEKKNWITYGFSTIDPFVDRLSMHLTAFTSISICLVSGSMYLAFVPDARYLEWSQREAYLELRRRESQGLPPIDPYYIHPDKVRHILVRHRWVQHYKREVFYDRYLLQHWKRGYTIQIAKFEMYTSENKEYKPFHPLIGLLQLSNQ